MARRWRAWLGVFGSFLLVPLVVLMAAAPAHACSCAMGGTKEYVEWADAIFTGTLVEVDAPDPDDGHVSRGDDITMLVAVDRVFKGEAPAQVEVVTSSGGASCGLTPPPVDGDPWLWFLHLTEEGRYTASICGGSGPAVEGSVARVVDLVGPGAKPGPVSTTSGDSTPGGQGSDGGPEGLDAESSDAQTEGAGADSAVWWGVGGLLIVLAAGVAGVVMVRRRA